jgi:hypothetical protein
MPPQPFVLLFNECLLLLLFISLSTQSGNFWIHPRTLHETQWKDVLQWNTLSKQPTNQPANKLTPWSRVFLEKLIVAQLVNKFSVIYGNLRFNTVFTRARHWSSAGPCETFLNKLVVHGKEFLGPCPAPKLQNHTLSAYLVTFAASFHIRKTFHSTNRERAMPWWQRAT